MSSLYLVDVLSVVVPDSVVNPHVDGAHVVEVKVALGRDAKAGALVEADAVSKRSVSICQDPRM